MSPPPSPPPPWTEARLSELGTDEHDFQEYKGTGWVWETPRINPWFHAAVSKQVSAFANGAGGRLFLGVDDDGLVDGGVPVDLKGGGTRSWLEDIVPSCVSPPLSRCNVFEVRGQGPASRIHPGHADYVLDIPSSPDAPHQALDHRYYLRIAGKSRPMNHVHLEDVLRRTRHPRVEMRRLGPFGPPEHDLADPRGPRAVIGFRAILGNLGRTLARHVGVELIVPRPFVGRAIRERTLREPGVHLTQSPGAITLFRYSPTPVFPGQEIYAQSVWIGLHNLNKELVRSGTARLRWRIFADDADPVIGERPIGDYGVVQKALVWLDSVGGA